MVAAHGAATFRMRLQNLRVRHEFSLMKKKMTCGHNDRVKAAVSMNPAWQGQLALQCSQSLITKQQLHARDAALHSGVLLVTGQ